jgi:L-asparaginase
MMVDSLEMTDAHRAAIVEGCREAGERRILVTHGTDTMIETARSRNRCRPSVTRRSS